MRLLRLALLVPLVVTSFLHAEKANCTLEKEKIDSKCRDILTGSIRPVALYGSSGVAIEYANLFRFDVNPIVTSTAIAAPTVPTGLAPSASSSAATSANVAPPGAVHATPGPNPNATGSPASNAGDRCAASLNDAQKVGACWQHLQENLVDQIKKISSIRKKINQYVHAADNEQRCYQVELKVFSQPLLPERDAKALIAFSKANTCAKQNETDWFSITADGTSDTADDAASALNIVQAQVTGLSAADGFEEWQKTNKALYAAVVKQVADLLNEATAYATGTSVTNPLVAQTYLEYKSTVDTNRFWRNRLKKIADDAGTGTDAGALIIPVNLPKCKEWYGRGRTDSVSYAYTDVSASAASAQTLPLATNTCTPLSIVSTGIGVSLLPSPVYGFIAGDNTGSQVIGKTSVNDISPLYAVLYNVQLSTLGHHGMELFASPGIGFTSSSNTTTTDVLSGISISFGRRLIFVTGSADFGRRDELLPGFSIGTAKGALTSVPVRSSWKPGAMLSISFGIGPS